MFELKAGDIIPGIGIGPFKLGADESTILQISSNFLISQPSDTSRIYTGNDIMIWVDLESGKIDQVLVEGSFQGKLLDKFGIGSYLR